MGGVSPGERSGGGKAAKAKAGQEQDQAWRRTSWGEKEEAEEDWWWTAGRTW